MKRLLIFIFCISQVISSWSQNTKTISGKVSDAQGNPLSGAAVQVKGNSRVGTTTGNDGSFKLNVPSNTNVLVITSIGFKPVEVKISNDNTVSVQLTVAEKDLDEVVVTVPYGTVKKTAFTGSEATISSKQIEKQQVASVTRAIEGLAPGVMATNGGGAPGSGASIVLRGFSSITGSAGPLYVLNGVPYDGSISSISPDDIESVTLLKDATASALYGSRAAGGVVMIQTKSGKKGRPSVTAKVTQGVMNRGIPEYERVGPKDYYEVMWEATRNAFVYGATPTPMAQAGVLASQQLTDASHLVYNAYNVPGASLIDPVTGKLNPNAQLLWNESWEDALYRAANRTNVTLNISGANDKSNYFISGGYLKEEGTMKFTDYNRYNFRMNVNTAATNWMNAGLSIDGTYSQRNSVIGSGLFTANPFYYSRNMGPIYPVYRHNLTTGAYVDSAGQHLLDWGVPNQMGARPFAANSNLLGSLELDNRSAQTINANANPYVEIKFLKDFTFRTNAGINVNENITTVFQNSQYGDAANVQGRSSKQYDRSLSFTINQLLNWNKQFEKHSVKALAGHESYKYITSQLSATKTGFSFPNFNELDNAGTTEGTPSSSVDVAKIESYFGQANYEYNGKYLLNANFRRDGTSRFAKDIRWGNFYSAGAGWRISREDFLRNVNWINDLKLKASYGQVGNEGIGQYYNYLDYYWANGYGQYVTDQNQIKANPDLKWEKSVKFNVGADFSLFKNRLQGTIEYFRNTNQDLIFLVNLPPSEGGAVGQYLYTYQNIGASRNAGIELQLGYNAIRNRNFDWRVDLNLTHIKNVVVKTYPNADKQGGFVSGTKKISTGYDQFQFWLRDFAGVDAATGEALYYKDVVDANGKATGERSLTNNISKASFYRFGSAIPKFNGGLTNSFRYKNFDLSILMTFAYGGKFYDANYAGLMSSGTYGNAWSTDILQRWQKPGDITNVPKVQVDVVNQDGTSSRFLFDASYLNIKNITLSYTLPGSTAKRLHVAGLQLFGNVDNAYLFTAKKGMDPQRSFTGTSDNSYPPFRTVTFGLNVNLQ